MKKKNFIAYFTLFALGMAFIFFYRNSPTFTHDFNSNEIPKTESYFVKIPVLQRHQTPKSLPCVEIKIGLETLAAQLDLGFSGYFSISREALTQIIDKKFLTTTKTYGFQGREYVENLFEIPEIEIGDSFFNKVPVHEEAEDFNTNSVLNRDPEKIVEDEPARIGWELFTVFNVLLDLSNGTIAFCDSIETLKNEGYLIDSFTQTDLILERDCVEISTETSLGPMKCILDTGCTFNMINNKEKEKAAGNELFLDLNKVKKIAQFKIANNEFGPITFHPIPIRLPIPVDAILGMEFFDNHLVFLDFKKNQAYFAPAQKIIKLN